MKQTIVAKLVTPLAGVWIEIGLNWGGILLATVTPLAGVWIEIYGVQASHPLYSVTPLAGVWIEIISMKQTIVAKLSLPSRECGLKSILKKRFYKMFPVTPLAGVWIEIGFEYVYGRYYSESLPSRECGLKSYILTPRIRPV